MQTRMRSGTMAMGMLCAAVGALAATLVVQNATGAGYEMFWLAAPVAAFATGAFFWWLFVARRNHAGAARGAFAGALAGALAHVVCWYLLFVGSFACHALTGGCTDSLGQPPMDPITAIPASALYSGFSLLFLGWLTVSAGAILGWLLALARRRAAAIEVTGDGVVT